MRDFRVVNKGDGTYINISQNQRVNENIKKTTGLTNLDALFLTEKEIENIFLSSPCWLMTEYYVLRETTEVRWVLLKAKEPIRNSFTPNRKKKVKYTLYT